MRPPSPGRTARRRRARSRPSAALAALALLLPAAGCCVTPPDADVILDLGYRTPEQTFFTFQVGMRGDLPRLEYACLSSDFRGRNGLSQLAYREFREQWMDENPWLRKGVAEAAVEARVDLADGVVRLDCSSYGHAFQVLLVREDFEQAWSGDRLVHDELIEEFSRGLIEEPRDDGGREVYAGTSLPPEAGGAPLTEFRIGREWKIDDVRQADPSEGPPES